MNVSISTRLALYYGLSLLLILCAFVVYLYSSFHVGLHQEFRAQLQRDESRLKQAIQITSGMPTIDFGRDRTSPTDYIEEGSAYVRVLATDGDVLYESPDYSQYPPFAPRLPERAEQAIVNTAWQGRPTQSLYAPLSGEHGAHIGWLEITRIESGIHRELHRLGWLLGIGIVLGAVMAIGSGHWMARRALRPIAAMTRAARDIQAESQYKRLPENFGIRDELTDLAETLNGLLGRLDATLERERRFRADAAHQMFTPLAAIQSEVEITLRRERGGADYRQALTQVQRQARSLHKIVEGLLQLSRAESLSGDEWKRCDVGALLKRRLRDVEALAANGGVTLRQDIAPDLYLGIPADHFVIVVDNLIENAIKYTPQGGVIDVFARRESGGVVFHVVDTGAGLSQEERRNVFDRFYRSDRQAIGSVTGIGLGLSIVQATVRAYGGEVSAESRGVGEGSRFTVWFPDSDPAQARTDFPDSTVPCLPRA